MALQNVIVKLRQHASLTADTNFNNTIFSGAEHSISSFSNVAVHNYLVPLHVANWTSSYDKILQYDTMCDVFPY